MIIPLTGNSTEPSLLHASCRPRHHVGLLQRLYLTLIQNGLPSTYIWPWKEHIQHHVIKACPSLTSNHVGTPPTTLSERPNTHIWPCRNTSHNPVRKAQHSHPIMREHIPQPYKKGSALISSHVGNTSCNHAKKALDLHLAMREHILQLW